MAIEFLNVEQNTIAWHQARLGLVTASCFADVISKNKNGSASQRRKTYMMKLLAERITERIQDNFTTEHTKRGHEDEPKARDAYKFEMGFDVVEVGFVKNAELMTGYSPDGLVGEDGAIEIKSKLPHLHLDVLLKDKVPAEHIAQIQGGLWVSGREWCDFISYSYGLPLFIKRVNRDEKKIKEIADATEIFNAELSVLEQKIRAMSFFQEQEV